ncbi:hypothetical protein [Crossiella sp. S99.2]|nr:hypothetical protein [Crossiella sp. S99.2]MCK2237166.1 hypothetical protein [Crossiella sp. S99.2]
MTWENMQERLVRLSVLAEELGTVAAGPVTTWLYREIETECALLATAAGEYIDECERLDRPPAAGPLRGAGDAA